MIIPASHAHAAFLAAVHAASFPPGARWDEAVMVAQLGLPGVFALVDAAGGMVLARVAGESAEVLTLAVMPPARRRGCARALLAAALAEAARRGAGAMFLEVGTANHAARALYAEAGFVPVGQRRRYYPDGSDAMVLRATLDGSISESQSALEKNAL